MQRAHWIAAAFALALSASTTWALIPYPFSLESYAWRANAIVVASQDKEGVVRVVESWKGPLTKDSVVEVVDLPKLPLFPTPNSPMQIKGEPIQLGGRMILFLRPDPKSTVPGTALKDVKKWEGAERHLRAKSSTVWLDNGKSYSFEDIDEKGHGVYAMCVLPYANEDAVRQSIVGTLTERDALEQTFKIVDPDKRSKALANLWKGHTSIDVEILGDYGAAALPVLLDLLQKSNSGGDDKVICDAILRAAPDEALAQLKTQAAFWKKNGPDLSSPEWWGVADPDLAQPDKTYGHRYAALDGFISALEKNGPYLPMRQTLVDLRESLSSIQGEPMQGLTMLKSTIKKCDAIIKAIDDTAPKTP